MSPPVDPTGSNECRMPEPTFEENECRMPEPAPVCSELEAVSTEPPASSSETAPTSGRSYFGDVLPSLWGHVGDFFVSTAAASTVPSEIAYPPEQPLSKPVRVSHDQTVTSSEDIQGLIEEARAHGRSQIEQLRAGPTAEFPQASANERVRAFRDSAAVLDLGINYYLNRTLDFAYRNPERPVPDYYLDYGHRYARRFMYETAPQLSETGQAWARNTLPSLQRAMNDTIMAGAARFANLERDEEAFKDYAYETHVGVYEASGIYRVADRGSLSDLIAIAGTPDTGDLLNWNGISLMAQLAPGIMGAMVFGE